MIKVVVHWKFNPQLDPEEAYRYYTREHGALGFENLADAPGLVRYVQNRVIARRYMSDYGATPQEREPEFDHSTEFHFVDREAMEAFFGHEREQRMTDDEVNFKDRWMDIYECSETVVAQRGPDGTFYARHPLPWER